MHILTIYWKHQLPLPIKSMLAYIARQTISQAGSGSKLRCRRLVNVNLYNIKIQVDQTNTSAISLTPVHRKLFKTL